MPNNVNPPSPKPDPETPADSRAEGDRNARKAQLQESIASRTRLIGIARDHVAALEKNLANQVIREGIECIEKAIRDHEAAIAQDSQELAGM